MEHLDIVFANRYLDALAEFQAGRQPMRSWAVALEASTNRFPLILQQLLVSISAHINLDLGIATAAVAPGDQLPGIQADFDQINGVLAVLVGSVEREIGEVSPGIHLLEQVGLRTETSIINFDMEKARDLAWHTAQHLAATPASQEAAAIELLDFKVAAFGQLLIHPPAPIALKLAPIRLPESDDVRHIIDVLANN
jgi:Family of unknown function (DUF5995)